MSFAERTRNLYQQDEIKLIARHYQVHELDVCPTLDDVSVNINRKSYSIMPHDCTRKGFLKAFGIWKTEHGYA